MDGEAKQPGREAEGVSPPKAPAYEPPAIAWEEELAAIAASSCATIDPLDCGDPRTTA